MPSGCLSSSKTANCAVRTNVGFLGRTLLALWCLYFADRMFFEFLSLQPSGGECLIELNHWRFCLAGEIGFLDEFSLLTGTMYRTLRSILCTSLRTAGQTRLSFCRMNVAFGKSWELFFFNLFAIVTCFCMEQRVFWKDGWFFLQMLNDKCTTLFRLACVLVHGKQLVCYSWISSFDVKTSYCWCGTVQVC